MLIGRILKNQSVSCVRRFSSFIKDTDDQGRIPGIYKWWDTVDPEWVGPYVHPLDEGPDFTFKDGRPTPFTTRTQMLRKLDQIELGKTIVQCLKEVNEAENLYEKTIKSSEEKVDSHLKSKPRSKGQTEIKCET